MAVPIAGLTLLGVACAEREDASSVAVPPRVVVVSAQDVPATLQRRLPGVLEPHRDATLAAVRGGTVVERVKEPGEDVRKGDVLLHLDAREARANRDVAQAALQEAEAVLTEQQHRWQRIDSLGDGISEMDRDAAHTAWQRALANREAAQARLRLAQKALSDMTLRAPFGGEVAGLGPELGETVGPGTPVARVVDVTELSVTVGLLGDEVRHMTHPDTRFSVLLGGQTHPAEVAHVSRAADPATLTWPVTLQVDGGPTLLPGLAVDVVGDFPPPSAATAQIPASALELGASVWVVTDSAAQQRSVSVLAERGSSLLVSGVNTREQVVLFASEGLVEGQRVVAVEEGR